MAFNLGEPFFNALNSADRVALEMDTERWLDEVLGGDFMSQALRSSGNKFNARMGNGSSWNDVQGRISFEKRTHQQIQAILKGSPEMINQLLFCFYDPPRNFEEYT